MASLHFQVDPKRQLEHGSFGLAVADDCLMMPAELDAILRRLKVRSVPQLVSMLRSFPTAFMAELDWEEPHFTSARDDAFERLRGHINPRLLCERTRSKKGMGALPPPGREETTPEPS